MKIGMKKLKSLLNLYFLRRSAVSSQTLTSSKSPKQNKDPKGYVLETLKRSPKKWIACGKKEMPFWAKLVGNSWLKESMYGPMGKYTTESSSLVSEAATGSILSIVARSTKENGPTTYPTVMAAWRWKMGKHMRESGKMDNPMALESSHIKIRTIWRGLGWMGNSKESAPLSHPSSSMLENSISKTSRWDMARNLSSSLTSFRLAISSLKGIKLVKRMEKSLRKTLKRDRFL